MSEKYYSIAIDGPAASGKSTAAKGVAKKLDFLYVDTGAMYRAFTLFMLERGKNTKDESEAEELLPYCDIREDRDGHVFLNEKDVTSRVREMDVSSNVSFACAHLKVREKMVAIQQEMAKGDNVVMDGRDIGTVVLKDATLKIYQIASVEARAMRRYREDLSKGLNSSLEDIRKNIEERDRIDSTRKNSPLKKADDAVLLDTSDLTIDEEIDEIIKLFNEKVNKNG